MYKWKLKSAATAGTPLLLLPMNFRKHMSGEYLRYGKWALDFIFFVFCAGGKTRQPFLPPACRTILKGSCIVCVFCAPRSGTRVWTCSLISGLLCIFSLLKKQHITSAAPMMIVSFSPSTHLVRPLYVPFPPYQNGFVLCV